MAVRLGGIVFLNARPLTLALDGDPGPFQVRYGVPSQCAAELHAGQTDLGLIPSIEYARGPRPYCLVPQVCVASRGPVLTVRLYARRPWAQIRRLALDLSSRTSVALVQILLAEMHGLRPELVSAAPDLDHMMSLADAALVIGDSVFRYPQRSEAELDLGQAWSAMTGLPFVYAFWVGRPGVIDGSQARHLVRARDLGRQRLGAIAAAFAAERPEQSADYYQRYLTDHIHHDMGAAELAGLREFYRLARAHHLIDHVPELASYDLADH